MKNLELAFLVAGFLSGLTLGVSFTALVMFILLEWKC